MKFPTMDEFAQMVAEKALDEYEYNGKTLRQWIEIIAASEHGTNLAGVGTDCISRQQAIDALRYAQHRFTVADEAGGMGTVKWSEYVIYFAAAERVLSDLPPAQPDIIRCRNCKFASGDSRICMQFGHSPIGELDFCAWAERRTDG